MNVTTEDIRKIKPGSIAYFFCEDASKMRSACSLVSIIKQVGMPENVVDYETKKLFRKDNKVADIVVIRPLREGDTKVLNL